MAVVARFGSQWIFGPEHVFSVIRHRELLSENVNRQNNLLVSGNPHAVYGFPLHTLKIGVWCRGRARKTI
jgi:hypothetical protein